MSALTTSVQHDNGDFMQGNKKKMHEDWLFLKIQRMTTLKAPCFYLPHTSQTTNELKEEKSMTISVDTGKAVDNNSALKESQAKPRCCCDGRSLLLSGYRERLRSC